MRKSVSRRSRSVARPHRSGPRVPLVRLFRPGVRERAGPGQRLLVRLLVAGRRGRRQRGLEGFVPLDLVLFQGADAQDLTGDPWIGRPVGRLLGQLIGELLRFVQVAVVDLFGQLGGGRGDALRFDLVQAKDPRTGNPPGHEQQAGGPQGSASPRRGAIQCGQMVAIFFSRSAGNSRPSGIARRYSAASSLRPAPCNRADSNRRCLAAATRRRSRPVLAGRSSRASGPPAGPGRRRPASGRLARPIASGERQIRAFGQVELAMRLIKGCRELGQLLPGRLANDARPGVGRAGQQSLRRRFKPGIAAQFFIERSEQRQVAGFRRGSDFFVQLPLPLR